VLSLEKQALLLDVSFEIICSDDGSFSLKNEENQKINLLTNSKFIELKKNIGRVQNRIFLAEKAQYEWIIFLDVDSEPKKNDYLKKYISNIGKSDFVFGGNEFRYNLSEKFSLKNKFAKYREAKSTNVRKRKPYKYIISANFMAKKSSFLYCYSKIKHKSYGNDYIISSILQKNKILISHIDNFTVISVNDDNEQFILKSKDALRNLYRNYFDGNLRKSSISILNAFSILENFRMRKVFLAITNPLEKFIFRKINSKNPNLILFDIFRLRYLCSIKDF
jgi:hypothetical protein